MSERARSAPATDETETIRAFIAVELPPDAKSWCHAALDRARAALGADETAVRWVRPEGIHLTLQFLGSVATLRVPILVDGLGDALAQHRAFDLAVGRLGVLPGPRAPRVVWLALVGDLEALSATQEHVARATAPLGFAREDRAFRPHVTLGRVRESAPPTQRAAIGRLPATWPDSTSQPFQVGAVSLMRSELGPGGARYSRVAEIPFT